MFWIMFRDYRQREEKMSNLVHWLLKLLPGIVTSHLQSRFLSQSSLLGCTQRPRERGRKANLE